MTTTPTTRSGPPLRRRTAALAAAAALVFAACGDDDGDAVPGVDDDTTTTVDADDPATTPTGPDATVPGTTDPDAAPGTLPDDAQPVSLEMAVRATVDAGSADYTIWATNRSLDELGSDDALGTGPIDGDDSDGVDGSVDFQQGLRSITVEVAGEQRSVYADRQTMYVELDDDEAVGQDADWGRVDVAEIEDQVAADSLAFGTTPDAYIALHDPAAVLEAVSMAQTGTAGPDDAGTTPDGDNGTDDVRRTSVQVALDQIDDPFLHAALRGGLGTADELTVYLWFDTTDDEPTIRRMAYDLGPLFGVGVGVGDPTMDPGTGDGTGTGDGAGTGDGTGTTGDGTGTTGDGAGTTGDGTGTTGTDDDTGTTGDGTGTTGTGDGTGTTGTDDGTGTTDDGTGDGTGTTGTNDGTGTADDGTGTTGPTPTDSPVTVSGPFVVVDLHNLGDADEIALPSGDDVIDLELSQLDTSFTVNLLAATGAPTGAATDEPDGTGVDGPGTGGSDDTTGPETEGGTDN